MWEKKLVNFSLNEFLLGQESKRGSCCKSLSLKKEVCQEEQ
jgi:hypothetical protein